MSINGVLEDLPLADVLQFIHLGRRTGTLFMWRDDEQRAEIGFHDGRIVGAWAPGHRKLGDLLVEANLLSGGQVEAALDIQRRTEPPKSLGRILVDSGAVRRDQIHHVVREQVKTTVFDLVTWRQGHFHFEVDELDPPDDFSVEPDEVLGDLDLNTQMLLLEATRLFDEKNRNAKKADPESAARAELDRRLRRAGLSRTPLPAERADWERQAAERPPAREGKGRGAAPAAENQSPPVEAIRCQVLSDDGELVALLRRQLPDELIKVVPIKLREAGNRVPGESAAPIVFFDLRGKLTADDIATVARTRPTAPIVALVPSEALGQAARKAGALSVVPAGDPTLVDGFRNLMRVFSHPQPTGTFGWGGRTGLRSFRRVVFDVQSGLLSATMALNLMHVISESVERAVLFLVQGDELVACGAFGFNTSGASLAVLTRGLKLRLGEDGVLRRAFDSGKPQSIDWEESGLPDELRQMAGRPASGQVVIFPVLGAERVVSLIYTDNGPNEVEIQDIRILELATSQVGVAFENELLRQRHGGDLDLGSQLD
jgi:hypothetical protein